jgi:hypothetical protein
MCASCYTAFIHLNRPKLHEWQPLASTTSSIQRSASPCRPVCYKPREYQTSFQEYTRIMISIAFLKMRGFSMVNQLQVRIKDIELSRNAWKGLSILTKSQFTWSSNRQEPWRGHAGLSSCTLCWLRVDTLSLWGVDMALCTLIIAILIKSAADPCINSKLVYDFSKC